jgi:hypothetical protein
VTSASEHFGAKRAAGITGLSNDVVQSRQKQLRRPIVDRLPDEEVWAS